MTVQNNNFIGSSSTQTHPHINPSTSRKRPLEGDLEQSLLKKANVNVNGSNQPSSSVIKNEVQRILDPNEVAGHIQKISDLYQVLAKKDIKKDMPQIEDLAKKICLCFNKLIATKADSIPSLSFEAYFHALGFLQISESINHNPTAWITLQADDAYKSVPKIIEFSKAHSDYFRLLLRNVDCPVDEITVKIKKLSDDGIKPSEYLLINLLYKRALSIRHGHLSFQEKTKMWDDNIQPILKQIQNEKTKQSSLIDINKISKSYVILIEYLIQSNNTQGIKDLHEALEGYKININVDVFMKTLDSMVKSGMLEGLSFYSKILMNDKITLVDQREQLVSYKDFETKFLPYFEQYNPIVSLNIEFINKIIDLQNMLLNKEIRSRLFPVIYSKLTVIIEKESEKCKQDIAYSQNYLTEGLASFSKEIEDKKSNMSALEKRIAERQKDIEKGQMQITADKAALEKINIQMHDLISQREELSKDEDFEAQLKSNQISSGILNCEMEVNQYEHAILKIEKQVVLIKQKNQNDQSTIGLYKQKIAELEDNLSLLQDEISPILVEKQKEIVSLTQMKTKIEKARFSYTETHSKVGF